MCARWAYYTDQASRGVLLSQNLAYDIKCAAFHQHYGVENIVDNNVFAFVNDEAGVRKPAYRGALVGGVALGSWQVALPWWVRLFHDKLSLLQPRRFLRSCFGSCMRTQTQTCDAAIRSSAHNSPGDEGDISNFNFTHNIVCVCVQPIALRSVPSIAQRSRPCSVHEHEPSPVAEPQA